MPDSKLEMRVEEKLKTVIAEIKTRLKNLESNYANKIQLIEQSSLPTLTVNGEMVLWCDTDDNKQYIITRANSSDKKIELT